ncbi:hypothetical protein RB653_009957 [Dictyostelium firmibasis]|uniref:Uncharacterized protein n=1 Tax=Dictyostelium firmibasis TaxID=79012 RepID=A0AAN7TK34_9MYCE
MKSIQKLQKTWLISGSSKGLGFSLLIKLLKSGYNVAAFTRKKESIEDSIIEFENEEGSDKIDKTNLMIVQVDITNNEIVKKSIEQVIERFEMIDVVVNCAGYGLFGAFEFCNEQEVFNQFQVNLFGMFNVVRNSIPYLRCHSDADKNLLGPRIYNISSICGFFSSFAGISMYNSSKAAIDGFSESLNAELKEKNIHVTTVNIGGLRTSFLKPNGDMVLAKDNNRDTYKSATDIIDKHYNEFNGHQLGDPNKVANILITMATNNPQPPMHLFLGSDSICLAQLKLKLLSEEIDKYKSISTSINFDESKPFELSQYISSSSSSTQK